MSLLDEATTGPRRGTVCWVQDLPEDVAAEMAEVDKAVDNGVRINAAELSRALGRRGVKISDVGRHLRRECKCRS